VRIRNLFEPGSGMEKLRSGLREEHPWFATLVPDIEKVSNRINIEHKMNSKQFVPYSHFKNQKKVLPCIYIIFTHPPEKRGRIRTEWGARQRVCRKSFTKNDKKMLLYLSLPVPVTFIGRLFSSISLFYISVSFYYIGSTVMWIINVLDCTLVAVTQRRPGLRILGHYIHIPDRWRI
jgi:hypothetical protein